MKGTQFVKERTQISLRLWMDTGADSAGEGLMSVKRDSTLNSEMAQEAKMLDVRSNDLCSRLRALTAEGEENPASCPLIYTHVPCMHISASTRTNENKGKPRSLHWKNRKVFLGHDPTYPRLQGIN